MSKCKRKLTQRLFGFKTKVLSSLDIVKCVYLGKDDRVC